MSKYLLCLLRAHILISIAVALSSCTESPPLVDIKMQQTENVSPVNETKRLTKLGEDILDYCFPDSNEGEKSEESTRKLRDKVIWGADNRHDYFCIQDEGKRNLAGSSVALVSDSFVDERDPTRIKLLTSTFGTRKRLCSFERFSEQIVVPYCSGALVSHNTVLTAGHCVEDDAKAQKTKFIFGYKKLEYDKPATTVFSLDQVYSGKSVLAREKKENGSDWALIKLDRSVDPQIAVPAEFDTNKNLNKNDSIFVIGYPSGLPLKLTDSARVLDTNGNEPYFFADLDTYGGNSGSPVFEEKTGMIVGVLVRGEEDFVPCEKSKCFQENTCNCNVPCRVSNICTKKSCEGEDVMKLTKIRKIDDLQLE